MEFWKRFNDYSSVEARDLDICELYHYTSSVEAVKNIATGCFWATDIRDFRKNGEDENEGYLILCQLLELIQDMDSLMASLVKDYIGTEYAMNKFFDKHETYIVSTCTKFDSTYMWNQYATNDGYQIVLDKKEFIDSLYIVLKNGDKRTDKNIFKHAQLLYDHQKQIDIIKKEYQGLIDNKDKALSNKDLMDYILQHLMYIGNFYKEGEKCYLQEDEYRILVNIAAHGKVGIDKTLPERKSNTYNQKHYIEIRFSPTAIKRIVCATEQAKNLIEGKISEMEIEIRDIEKEV